MVKTPVSEIGNLGSSPSAPANYILEYKCNSYWLYDKDGNICFISDLDEMRKMVDWINWCEGKLDCAYCGHPAIEHAHHTANHYCHTCSGELSPVGMCFEYKIPGMFNGLLKLLGL